MEIEWLLNDTVTAAVRNASGTAGGGRLVVVGVGNIGSFAADLAARMPEVKAITLIDPGTYEEKNRTSQNIAKAAIGKAKVRVAARRLAAIRSDLHVTAIQRRVQDVPLGLLRAEVILGCLDSRAARCYVNEVARLLGVPWVDAGVEPSSLLVRVNTYRPEPDAPCYECPFSAEDYRQLEVVYPCAGGRSDAPATNAPASLGALAAALQVLEAGKVLRGQWDLAAVGKQVTLAAGWHRHFVTRFAANPHCRCGHNAWPIHPATLTAQDRPQQLAALLPGSGEAELAVFRQTFARQWACTQCGSCTRERAYPVLARRRSQGQATCPDCGGVMQPVGFSQTDSVNLETLRQANRPLSWLGLENGDLVTLRRGGDQIHLLLGTRHRMAGDGAEGRPL